MRDRRREYEIMVVISPMSGSEEGVTEVLERLKQSITNAGGELTAVNQTSPWGRRKLAYPIRDYVSGEASRRSFTEGFYVLLNVGLSASKVIDVERTIKLTDSILRYLITVVEPHSATPTDEDAQTVAEKSEA